MCTLRFICLSICIILAIIFRLIEQSWKENCKREVHGEPVAFGPVCYTAARCQLCWKLGRRLCLHGSHQVSDWLTMSPVFFTIWNASCAVFRTMPYRCGRLSSTGNRSALRKIVKTSRSNGRIYRNGNHLLAMRKRRSAWKKTPMASWNLQKNREYFVSLQRWTSWSSMLAVKKNQGRVT